MIHCPTAHWTRRSYTAGAPMTWSPLAGSELRHGTTPRQVEIRSIMERIADEVGASHITEVALAFILKHPSRPQPILGSNQLSRVSQMAGSPRLRLSRQQWFAVLIASRGSALPSPVRGGAACAEVPRCMCRRARTSGALPALLYLRGCGTSRTSYRFLW